MEWLRDEADERLEGLFSENAQYVRKSMQDLYQQANEDPEVEELILDTFQSAIDDGNDDTAASAWLAILLGEISCEAACGPLLQSLAIEEDFLNMAARRSLQQLGEPAYESIFSMIEEQDYEQLLEVDADLYANWLKILEGVNHYGLSHLRARLEAHLSQRIQACIAQHGQGEAPPIESNYLRQIEACSLTLANLGCVDQLPLLTKLHMEVCKQNNAFVQEAMESMNDNPGGLPALVSTSWEEEFRWALDGEPSGDLGGYEEEEATGIYQSENERIVNLQIVDDESMLNEDD